MIINKFDPWIIILCLHVTLDGTYAANDFYTTLLLRTVKDESNCYRIINESII